MTMPDPHLCAVRRSPLAVLRALRLGLQAALVAGSVLCMIQARGHWGVMVLCAGVLATQLLVLAEERFWPRRCAQHARELQRGLLLARAEILRTHSEHVAELNALSSEIAHELKNPLTCVKGVAELMALERDPVRAADRLCVLHGQVERTLKILDEFLQLSRPLVPLAQETIDLRALYGSVAELFDGVSATGSAADDEPLPVRCDPRKMRQVMIYLFQSALAVKGPQGQLSAVLKRLGDHVGFIIHVEGPQDGGSCLDLKLARSLIELHGGSLVIDHSDAVYKTVVLLPRAEVHEAGVKSLTRPGNGC